MGGVLPMTASTGDESTVPSFADRLRTCFLRVRKPDGSEYSLREVSDAITTAGIPISHAYVGLLRNGTKDNPHLQHVTGLARFFGVPVDYFATDNLSLVDAVNRELSVLSGLKELQGSVLALRESVLPQAEAGLAAIQEIINAIRGLEDGGGRPPAGES
jgi:hypothetical protein